MDRTTSELRVLIVDNEIDAREWLAEWLRESQQYLVNTASDGPCAIQMIRDAQGRYDVILMDLRLGTGMNGLETMRAIKTEYPQSEVIIMTGFGGVNEGVAAMHEGACNYVYKPLSRDELLVYVRAAGERRRLRAALTQTQVEREWLQSMVSISGTFQSALELNQVLQMIVNGIHRLGYDRARLYLLQDDVMIGRVETGGASGDFEGLRLDLKKDIYSQRTLASTSPIIYKHGELGPDENDEKLQKVDLEEWAELPLRVGDKPVGKLTVDNKYSRRPISNRDLEMLTLFANQAAIAIENAHLFNLTKEQGRLLQQRSDRLEKILSVSSKLFSHDLDQLLTDIAEAIRTSMGFNLVVVSTVEDENTVRVRALAGHDAHARQQIGQAVYSLDVFMQPMQERFRISNSYFIRHEDYSWEKEYKGRVFTPDLGDRKVDEWHAEDALRVPMVTQDHRTIGFISVDDPVDHQRPSLESIQALEIFANQATAAIENARAYDLQRETQNYLDQLISSSLDGIIAVDLEGWVTKFNPGAERILGYRADEVLNKMVRVDKLHGSLKIAQEIKYKLFANPDGKLGNYESSVVTKDGVRIPILLSAAQLYDSEGAVLGSVGYFKDMRPLRKAQAAERLLSEVINTVARAATVRDGLQALADKTVEGLPVTFALMLLLDNDGKTFSVKASSPAQRSGNGALEWDPGLGRSRERDTMKELFQLTQPTVFREGDIFAGQDVLVHLQHVVSLKKPLRLALVVPLQSDKEVLGLCVLGEERSWKRSPFDNEKIGLAARVMDQAAGLIAQMRLQEQVQTKVQELERLRHAAQALASAASIQEVLDIIVTSARNVLNADSSVIWSYDAAHEAFFQDELVANGIPAQTLDRFRHAESKPGRTTLEIFDNKLIEIRDVYRDKPGTIGESTRELLTEIHALAFQGLALEVSEERLGILYINYKEPRTFDHEGRDILKSFGDLAALALKNARLMDQFKKSNRTAEVVTRVTQLGDLAATMKSVVEGTMQAVGCDAVTLFRYNPVKKNLDHPPVMVGVTKPERALQYGRVLKPSIVYTILQMPGPYFVESSADDELFRNRRFTKHEGIRACAAIPLQVGADKVGVMFVNYRSPHRFTPDEKANIELFAGQAAVAISNANLYDQIQKRMKVWSALYEAGQAVTSSLDRNEILRHIVEQAWQVTAPIATSVGFSNIALRNGNILNFVEAYPRDAHRRMTHSIDLAARGPIGVAGLAVKTGQTQLESDVHSNPQYLEADPSIRSELAVPIRMGTEIIGVINVEHPDLAAFDQDSVQALEGLAAQAALAIHNARQYEELKRVQSRVASRTALAWMGMVSNVWRHTIEKHAQTIRVQVHLLRTLLKKTASDDASIGEHLTNIERLAKQIQDKPITPPLSVEEGVLSVRVNELVQERVQQLWSNAPYKLVKYATLLHLSSTATVRASPEWLRRALDVLIDNAVEATQEVAVHYISITTRQVGTCAEIVVADTGKGIPDAIQAKLLNEPIPKAQDDKGLGMGLLMAQTIVQTYDGEIRLGSSGPGGTSMIISLPLEIEGGDTGGTHAS